MLGSTRAHPSRSPAYEKPLLGLQEISRPEARAAMGMHAYVGCAVVEIGREVVEAS